MYKVFINAWNVFISIHEFNEPFLSITALQSL